ncbi:dihydrolipoamide acetyltransferase family protein [Bacteroidetes bacterium endosymbiont of Geopemphigus sp.]|uniref:dihydrolipoamide acetyltransferase family protein n=1 Tax=Bacteroidetes bacterium endosymbiont of Geopemphigus sp. TaxID=2047937 RepID=UPI000CD0EB0F|nr:dihydrolipoamide acetyltransferase family protein [Bacteroidetes bacterium endosymbiont of Geopemphigus sp.]
MAEYYLSLPAMGESVTESTITSWLKNEGDPIEEEEVIVEIATDKVDSEVSSPVSGVLKKKMFSDNQVAKVGEVIAILEIKSENKIPNQENLSQKVALEKPKQSDNGIDKKSFKTAEKSFVKDENHRFYSPLVRSMAQKENISFQELSQIKGKGREGRLTKDDLQAYLTIRSEKRSNELSKPSKPKVKPCFSESEEEIIEMDRSRKLMARHMLDSQSISAHVSSFVEADMTRIVQWREKIKDDFKKRTGEKLTFMPFFVKAVVQSIKDFPLINSVIQGNFIIQKKNIHIGMATALPNGNLIVPIIKNAETYNLTGLAKIINDLANRARKNALKPYDTQGGTYTITNMGSFGNLLGTPIIHQPQLAILGVGAIQKKPAIIETPQGDLIGIRHKMFLSHSYDHRLIDGALGGGFVKQVAYYLENFDTNDER